MFQCVVQIFEHTYRFLTEKKTRYIHSIKINYNMLAMEGAIFTNEHQSKVLHNYFDMNDHIFDKGNLVCDLKGGIIILSIHTAAFNSRNRCSLLF